MTVPKDVEELGQFTRRFYLVAHVIALMTLLLFKNTLTIFAGIRIFIEIIAAAYFYLQCTDSSGDALPVTHEQELERISISSVQQEIDQEDQPQELPIRNYCSICKSIQTYRTKHCTKCQKCIPKYDHHCFWIGGCVGELNHRVFWSFLFFQTLVCIEAFKQYFAQLDFYCITDEYSGHDIYKGPYFVILLCATASLGFSFFTGALLFYHSMLIMSGKTTWEHTKKDKITYLKFYPKYYHPYDYGIIRNIIITFNHHNQLNTWVPTQRTQIKPQFNIFENQYYSCC